MVRAKRDAYGSRWRRAFPQGWTTGRFASRHNSPESRRAVRLVGQSFAEMAKKPRETSQPPFALSRRSVGIAVIIAALPAWGFFLAYMYEIGYADALMIDRSHVRVDITGVLATAYRVTAWVALGTIVIQTANFGLSAVGFPSLHRMYGYVIFESILVGCAAYWLAWGLESEAFRTVAVAVGVGLIATVVLVAMNWFESRRYPDEPGLAQAVARLIDSGFYPLVAGSVILAAFTYWSGQADASHQERFDVLLNDPSIVILRTYDDRAVGARLINANVVDRDSRIVVRLGEAGAREFQSMDLGRLQFAEWHSRGPIASKAAKATPQSTPAGLG